MNTPTGHLVIAGDIGGTNGRLQLWQVDMVSSILTPKLLFIKKYRMALFQNLTDLLKQLMKDAKFLYSPVDACVLAVCGPVWENGRKNDPNNLYHANGKRWPIISAAELEKNLGWEQKCILFQNDFEAIGAGVGATVNPSSPIPCRVPVNKLECLYQPAPPSNVSAPLAVIGAGTGLGVCYLTPYKTISGNLQYQVFPSEGGMTNSFSPRSEVEWKLKLFLQKRHNAQHVEVEKIVSGPGIVSVYVFFFQHCSNTMNNLQKKNYQNIMENPIDKRPARVAHFAKLGDPICLQAVDLFLDVYGRVAGSAALYFMPYSGLYVAGGVLPKLKWRLHSSSPDTPTKHSLMVRQYLDQGEKMTPVVARVPLYLVDDDDVGLRGSLSRALQIVRFSMNSQKSKL